MRPLIDFLESNILPELQQSDPVSSADLKVLLAQVQRTIFRQMTDQTTQTEKTDRRISPTKRSRSRMVMPLDQSFRTGPIDFDKEVGNTSNDLECQSNNSASSHNNAGCKRKNKTKSKMMVTRSQRKLKRSFTQAFCNDFSARKTVD